MFSWIPFYEELATHLLAYENRQPELVAMLDRLTTKGLKVGTFVDASASGSMPLVELDPFTFMGTFNRSTTVETRLAVVGALAGELGVKAVLPNDFYGIPLMNPQAAWFFAYAKNGRKPDDIPALWALFRQAVEGGRAAVSATVYARAMQVKAVGPAKLTMGLFWAKPRQFLPLDKNTSAWVATRGVTVGAAGETWETYRKFLESVEAQVSSDFPEVSRQAYDGPATQAKPRFWAGGHMFGDTYMQETFKKEGAWWYGYPADDASRQAQVARQRFAEIRVGDHFAVKGFGGKNDLKIHAIGTVTGVDPGKNRLAISYRDGPLFKGKAPATTPGGGSWFDTLSEVTAPEAIAAIFGGQVVVGPGPTSARPDVPLNYILFGPPGTGKTWLMRRMREKFRLGGPTEQPPEFPDVAELTWFQVVALAVHDLKQPSTAAQVVAHPLVQAKYVERAPQTKLSPFVWAQLQTHTVRESKNVHYERRSGPLVFDCDSDRRWFLPNGLPEDLAELLAGDGTSTVPVDTAPDNQFFVTFHPSFTYEEFVEGIRAESTADGERSVVHYPVRAGIFKQACERAVQLAGFSQGLAAFCDLAAEERRTMLADAKPVVVFVDEINRGNIARVFGELITLLEPDKRLGAEEELIVKLPGSGQRFGVPSNVWLIGTMNTADRSVVALDIALRRRFEFRECPPEPSLLAGVDVEGVDLGKLLTAINHRLLVLRDRDHLIGHAFFMHMKNDPDQRSLAELRRVFRGKILPLLLEYFHDDLGRVGLVLGGAFVEKVQGSDVFAAFEHDQREDLAERSTWRLIDVDGLGADAFRKIHG